MKTFFSAVVVLSFIAFMLAQAAETAQAASIDMENIINARIAAASSR